QKCIALAVFRIFEVSHRADGFTGRCKLQLYRIVETSASNPFKTCAIRTNSPDSRSEALVMTAVLRLDVKAVAAISQVQPAVRPEKRTVQTGRVGGHRPARDDNFLHVGDTVSVRI